MKEKIYDRTFKRMFKLSKRMLIKFVNQIFKKSHSLDEEVIFLDVSTISEDNDVLEKDLYFQIQNERYQIEAQTYWDDMMFRLFEYATNSIEGNYEKIDSSHAIFRIPQQAVVYLKDTNKTNNKLYIKIIPPNGESTEYVAEAVRALGYSPQDKEMCYNIVEVMDELKQQGQVTNDEYQQMFLIMHELYDNIYGDIDDISEKGADSMIKEKYISTYDKALMEGAYENSLKTAEKMIKAKESVEKIELYTELKLADIKPLAEKLGIGLVI